MAESDALGNAKNALKEKVAAPGGSMGGADDSLLEISRAPLIGHGDDFDEGVYNQGRMHQREEIQAAMDK